MSNIKNIEFIENIEQNQYEFNFLDEYPREEEISSIEYNFYIKKLDNKNLYCVFVDTTKEFLNHDYLEENYLRLSDEYCCEDEEEMKEKFKEICPTIEIFNYILKNKIDVFIKNMEV